MSAQTATGRPVRLPETWPVLLVSVLAVIAISLAVSAWQRSAAAPYAPAQMHATPAPSPGPMAAAFARVVAL